MTSNVKNFIMFILLNNKIILVLSLIVAFQINLSFCVKNGDKISSNLITTKSTRNQTQENSQEKETVRAPPLFFKKFIVKYVQQKDSVKDWAFTPEIEMANFNATINTAKPQQLELDELIANYEKTRPATSEYVFLRNAVLGPIELVGKIRLQNFKKIYFETKLSGNGNENVTSVVFNHFYIQIEISGLDLGESNNTSNKPIELLQTSVETPHLVSVSPKSLKQIFTLYFKYYLDTISMQVLEMDRIINETYHQIPPQHDSVTFIRLAYKTMIKSMYDEFALDCAIYGKEFDEYYNINDTTDVYKRKNHGNIIDTDQTFIFFVITFYLYLQINH